MKKRLLSAILVFCIIVGVASTAYASDILREGRFRYYTVEDPEWTYKGTTDVSAKEATQIQTMGSNMWKIIGTAGDYLDPYNSSIISTMTDMAYSAIRESNADFGDEGTYIFYVKNRTTYKQHLETQKTYIDRVKLLVRVDFSIQHGADKNSRVDKSVTMTFNKRV